MTHYIHSFPAQVCVSFPSLLLGPQGEAKADGHPGDLEEASPPVPAGLRLTRCAPACVTASPPRPALVRALPALPHSRRAALGQAATPSPSLPVGHCAQDQAPVPLKGNGGVPTTAPTLQRPG